MTVSDEGLPSLVPPDPHGLLITAWNLATREFLFAPTHPGAIERTRELRDLAESRTIVCAACYFGYDTALHTRAKLMYRGHRGGVLRPHFAHAKGHGPINGHTEESAWHLTAKALINAWAKRQAAVEDVDVEKPFPGVNRIPDVAVTFHDGTRLAIEIQQQPLTDDQWQKRHDDYANGGVEDLWLWRSWSVAGSAMARLHEQPLWELDPYGRTLHLVGCRPHEHHPRQPKDPDIHALHYKRADDRCDGPIDPQRWRANIDELVLSRGEGIEIPRKAVQDIERDRAAVAECNDRLERNADLGRKSNLCARQSKKPAPVPVNPLPRSAGDPEWLRNGVYQDDHTMIALDEYPELAEFAPQIEVQRLIVKLLVHVESMTTSLLRKEFIPYIGQQAVEAILSALIVRGYITLEQRPHPSAEQPIERCQRTESGRQHGRDIADGRRWSYRATPQ